LSKIFSNSSSLKKLTIRISPRHLTKDMGTIYPITAKPFVSRIAQRLWSPSLESLEIKCYSHHAHTADQLIQHWIVRKDTKDGFVITDCCATFKQNWYKRCEKLLGEPIVRPDDAALWPRWEVELDRRVQIHNATAPNRLD
jgi:hypothetical protein